MKISTMQVFFDQLSNDSFSIEQKVLEQQIELHIGAIQSRVRIRFIHELMEQHNQTEQQNSFRNLFSFFLDSTD